jgi:hypothetical protein
MKNNYHAWTAGEGCWDCPHHGPDDEDCLGTVKQWYHCTEPWGNNPGGKRSKTDCMNDYLSDCNFRASNSFTN